MVEPAAMLKVCIDVPFFFNVIFSAAPADEVATCVLIFVMVTARGEYHLAVPVFTVRTPS